MDAASHEHIAVVDRDRDVADAHLSGAGGAYLNLLEAQHLRTAVFIVTKRLAHGASPFTKSEDSRHERLEIEFKRLQHARVHIVGADEDGQFDNLSGGKMALDIGQADSGTPILAGIVRAYGGGYG